MDKNSIIKDTETTLEKMVKEITVEKVEMAQNYATAVDVGYEDFETDAWCRMLYLPSPIMPKRRLSKYLHWWTFMDLYEAVLDKLIADVKNRKIASKLR